MSSAGAGRSDFATRLYDKLARTRAGDNLFLSPFSIRVALAMCAVGARGETRRVLAELIGAPESVEEQNRQYAMLLKSVQGEGDRPFQLVTANALWGQQGCHFNPEFQQVVADFYGGSFHEVNFRAQPDEAVRTINAWVSGKTREKVRELIRRDLISDDTRLVLTNAIHFKGEWQDVFPKHSTDDEDWHGHGGRRRVPMMRRIGDYSYCEGDGFQALDIPYKGARHSMLVVLPRKEGEQASGSQVRRRGHLSHVTAGLHEQRVAVSLPRFRTESEFDLKRVLCDLGADLAFDDQADFGGVGEEPLKVSEVVHKAFVEVNEEGTEAAAATDVGMFFKGITRRPEPKVFKADHPFLFFIRDRNTNAVLFCGRVLDPR
jgi:serpin B